MSRVWLRAFFLSFVDSAPFCSRVHHIARHDKITLTGAVMRDIRALRKIRTFFLPEDFHFQLDRAPKFHLSADRHLGLSELAGSCRFLANPTLYRVTRLARRLLFRSDAIDAIGSIDRSQSLCHLRRVTKVRPSVMYQIFSEIHSARPRVVRSASITDRFLTNRVTL